MSQFHDFGAQSTADAVRGIAQAVGVSDFPHASKLADAALAKGLIHPAFFNARALWLERQGQDEAALTCFQQARALAPKDVAILNAIGLCLTRLLRLDEALEVFDEAIRMSPAYAATYQRKAVALGLAGRRDAAERAHNRAVQLDPRNVEALASLAAIAARKGDVQSARAQAQKALAIDSRNATAHAALALIELSQGEFTGAENRLRPLLDDPHLAGHGRAVALGLLGDALDGQDRSDEAFAAYSSANADQKRLHAPRFQGKPGAADMVERLIDHFSEAPREPWRTQGDRGDPAQGPTQHVFLLGFHRSGTTLLEQALESHPDIVTLDERDFLAQEAERYLTSAAGLARLSVLEGEALTIARSAYWQHVRGQGIKVEGKAFVDKHPFNTIKLPLIVRLFPDAKIFFALRDPRDVVLSCFRRHFDVDFVKFEYLSLDCTARLYDLVMRFGELARERLPLALFQHRYEDLVADFEGRTRAVCEFIGVPWSDSMHDFAAAARALDAHSASAQQVQRGLYGEGVGQWRRYRRHLAPVLPLLQPWVERFGYSRD